jgi:hypothetical protein
LDPASVSRPEISRSLLLAIGPFRPSPEKSSRTNQNIPGYTIPDCQAILVQKMTINAEEDGIFDRATTVDVFLDG